MQGLLALTDEPWWQLGTVGTAHEIETDKELPEEEESENSEY